MHFRPVLARGVPDERLPRIGNLAPLFAARHSASARTRVQSRPRQRLVHPPVRILCRVLLLAGNNNSSVHRKTFPCQGEAIAEPLPIALPAGRLRLGQCQPTLKSETCSPARSLYSMPFQGTAHQLDGSQVGVRCLETAYRLGNHQVEAKQSHKTPKAARRHPCCSTNLYHRPQRISQTLRSPAKKRPSRKQHGLLY